MSMADELGKLERLHRSGALSPAEFEAAKQRLLSPEPPAEDNSIGRAANRFVSYQMILGVVALIIFVVVVLTVFVPAMNEMGDVNLP